MLFVITVEEARKILEAKYSGVKAKTACEYGDRYYLFVAPMNGSMDEPYYLVDKYKGLARYMNPLEDFELFDDATTNRVIKQF